MTRQFHSSPILTSYSPKSTYSSSRRAFYMVMCSLLTATHMTHVFAVRYSHVTSTGTLVRSYQYLCQSEISSSLFLAFRDSARSLSCSLITLRVRLYQYLVHPMDSSFCFSLLSPYKVLVHGTVPKVSTTVANKPSHFSRSSPA